MQNPKITNVQAGTRTEPSPVEEPKSTIPPVEPVAESATVPPAVPIDPPPPMDPPIDPVAKLRVDLDQLAVAGKIEEEFNILGFQFKLHTLTAGQNTEVLQSVTAIDDNDVKFSTMRYYLLARAIQTINGIPLEVLYKGTKEISALNKRIEIIRAWQQTFVNAIFEKYDGMIERSEKANEEALVLKN